MSSSSNVASRVTCSMSGPKLASASTMRASTASGVAIVMGDGLLGGLGVVGGTTRSGGHAAVDGQHRSGHVRGGVGCEEAHAGRHLLGRPGASGGDRREQVAVLIGS